MEFASPKVTVVIATYNRPDSLAKTIQSVLLQSEPNWQLLVIGDCCDPRTLAVIEQVADPRIRYVNLPQRCCEQSGPNSVGMLLADTEFVALLNHDDLWLPDHLQRALQSLHVSAANLYIARSAFCSRSVARDDLPEHPHFSETNPIQRKLRDAYTGAPFLFEPCSSWVMRRSLIDTVGPWRSGRTIYRTTLQDWLLRAWRKGAKLYVDQAVTTLKFNTHHQAPARENKPTYLWGSGEQAAVLHDIVRHSPEQLRQQIERDIGYQSAMTQPPRDFSRPGLPKQSYLVSLFRDALLSIPAAWFFRLTGCDGFNLYSRYWGMAKGERIARQVATRLAEPLPTPYDLGQQLAYAREEIARNER